MAVQRFKDFLSPKKIRVEVQAHYKGRLDEATQKTVGRYTARRDQPHFQGDEYHAHAEIPGGYEVSWNISGTRRHENTFPESIPNDARLAVAAVLKVDPSILESSQVDDPLTGERIWLLEIRRS